MSTISWNCPHTCGRCWIFSTRKPLHPEAQGWSRDDEMGRVSRFSWPVLVPQTGVRSLQAFTGPTISSAVVEADPKMNGFTTPVACVVCAARHAARQSAGPQGNADDQAKPRTEAAERGKQRRLTVLVMLIRPRACAATKPQCALQPRSHAQ